MEKFINLKNKYEEEGAPEIHRRMSSTIHLNRVICFYQWELGFELLTFYLKLISNILFFSIHLIFLVFSRLLHIKIIHFWNSQVNFFFSVKRNNKKTQKEELRAKKRDLHMHLVLGSLATLSPKTMPQLTWIHYLHP